jgi:apolipoprotein N-acyltransferase
VASGLLLAAARPPLAWSWLAWVALVPLWLAAARVSGPRAFGLGWLGGTVAQAAILHWTLATLTTFSTLSLPVAVGVVLILAAVLGLPLGLFAAGLQLAQRRGHGGPIAGAAWFVATEWIGTWAPFPYPWALLGASQHDTLPVAQMAEVGGVFALSALIALVNGAVATVLLAPRGLGRGPVRNLALVTAMVGVVATWGAWRMAAVDRMPAVGTLRVGIVHVPVDQKRKWSLDYRQELMAQYAQSTQAVAADHPDVIAWPETATPFYFEDDPGGRRQVEALARMARAPLLFGSPAVERNAAQEVTYHNRAYLLDADARVAATYDKRVLVPFGEYVPHRWLLPFVRPLITSPQAMVPGASPGVLPVGAARLGVSLCYESAFGSLARAAVARGATVLVNLSNDAWFTGTSGSAQALALARLRAIEVRRPLVRVASGGDSAVVAPSGRIVWSAGPEAPGQHVASVDLAAARTPFARWGDVIVWVAVAVAAWSLRR